VRIALTLDRNQVRAHHAAAPLRPRADPKRISDLATQSRASQPEFIHRPRQRERLKSGYGKIFNQAKTHFPLL
jgi:hypothetical protein